MDTSYKPNQPICEVYQDGMIDVHCISKPLLMGKKSVRVIGTSLNPFRAASRALAFCGTSVTPPKNG